MVSDLLTVKLEKLTYGGDALGRLPALQTGSGGRVVFVRFALPGETVRVRVLEEKRNHIRAELIDVLEPSPERIVPKCIHYGVCGGCHYQHISYQSQLKEKTQILRDQLVRIGKIENPPVQTIIPSLQEWNYRNHVQFHLTQEGKLGYIDAIGRNVIPIRECHLPEGPLNEIWPSLEFAPGLNLKRISLRLGAHEALMLVLESDSPVTPELDLETDLSVVHLTREDVIVMAGDEFTLVAINDRPFRVSPASFFQVNTKVAAKLVEHLLANLLVMPDETLLDIYCGVGLFSAFFAPRVRHLIGIESSPSACDDFEVNLDEFSNVELYKALAEDVLPMLDVYPDAVIVDPPRTGLDKRVLQALLDRGPQKIAYVSCDPSTLGRDAGRFIAGGYRLVQVTPFDLFPQTYHIESISIFEKG